MTPEQMAYCVAHSCDRNDPEVKRLMDENDRIMTAQHEHLLRDDPSYAAQWRAGIRAFADQIDADIAAKVFSDLSQKK